MPTRRRIRASRRWTDAAEPVGWRALDVGSPFDYRTPGDLLRRPAPAAAGARRARRRAARRDRRLVEAAGGRTLGLFSSRRAAETAAEHVRDALPDLDLWCQGDAQLPELAAAVRRGPEQSCLFGTLIAVAGRRPAGRDLPAGGHRPDPVPATRRPADERAAAGGRAARRQRLHGVAATHAALLLAQGSGRLIRRADDRGVVAVLDPRLVTARYGSFLAASLPPMWRTTDRDVVLGSLRRLAAG